MLCVERQQNGSFYIRCVDLCVGPPPGGLQSFTSQKRTELKLVPLVLSPARSLHFPTLLVGFLMPLKRIEFTNIKL